MLVLSRKVHQDIVLFVGDQEIVVRIAEIRGDKVRLGFDCEDCVKIKRIELLKTTGDYELAQTEARNAFKKRIRKVQKNDNR